MKSTILENITGNQDAQLPHLCRGAPAEGFALAIGLAEEGKRVIVLSKPNLVRYRKRLSAITVIEDDIETTEGFDTASRRVGRWL